MRTLRGFNRHEFEQALELVMDKEVWHAIQFMGSQRVRHD